MQLSNKDIRILSQEIKERYFLEDIIKKKSKIEKKDNMIYQDDFPLFFYFNEMLVPTLKFLIEKKFIPSVIVDMPAVPFIVKGADIMRPGIVEMEDFEKDKFVVIVDQINKTPLSVGLALFSSDEINKMDKGKVIKNIHFLGDDIWNS